MPIEIGILRIDGGIARIASARLVDERPLQDVVEQDVSILGLG